MTVKKYDRYGLNVSGVEEYHNQHRDICMCHQNCSNFKPDDQQNHCPIAAMSFQLSREVGIVLVMECNRYEEETTIAK